MEKPSKELGLRWVTYRSPTMSEASPGRARTRSSWHLGCRCQGHAVTRCHASGSSSVEKKWRMTSWSSNLDVLTILSVCVQSTGVMYTHHARCRQGLLSIWTVATREPEQGSSATKQSLNASKSAPVCSHASLERCLGAQYLW